jgi:hypothetical protein
MVGLENREYDFGLGYNLGFCRHFYAVDAPFSITGESLLNLDDDNYFLLAIDDFYTVEQKTADDYIQCLAKILIKRDKNGIIFDDDMEKNQHRMINKTIENSINRYTLAEPEKLKGCLETFLGLSIPKDNYKKDLEILKALTEGKISDEKLQALQIKLCNALAINIMS